MSCRLWKRDNFFYSRLVDNSLEVVKQKLEKLRMGSVDEKGREEKGRGEAAKEDKEGMQAQMSLALKVKKKDL